MNKKQPFKVVQHKELETYMDRDYDEWEEYYRDENWNGDGWD